MPTAVNAAMLAIEFGGEARQVGDTGIASTALSLLVLSLLVLPLLLTMLVRLP